MLLLSSGADERRMIDRAASSISAPADFVAESATGWARHGLLEAGCCKACNNGTGKTDLVASLVGRLSSDGSTDLDAAEFKNLLTGVTNNVSGLLEESRSATRARS